MKKTVVVILGVLLAFIVGAILLSAQGYHPIEVAFFESGGTASLSANYAGPGIPYQEIPRAALFCENE